MKWQTTNILFFNQIGIDALAKLVRQNASLEMYNQLNPIGIAIPNGFALTEAYRLFRNKIIWSNRFKSCCFA
jgi:pyruvate,water dikinase